MEEDKKLKLLLYSLYILIKYRNKEITNIELNSLMIDTIGTIDNDVKSKEVLIIKCKDILKSKNQNGSLSKGDIIKFKIGDIIRTGLSSSMISLKFIFRSELNKMDIDVFENEELKTTINI